MPRRAVALRAGEQYSNVTVAFKNTADKLAAGLNKAEKILAGTNACKNRF